MNLPELQKRINLHVQLDLAPLYDAYKEQSNGDDGIDGFLSFLATARVIDASLLKELHAEGGVEIPAAGDPALAGTHLADWMDGKAGAEQASAAQSHAEVRFQPLTRLGQGAMGAIDIARDLYLRRKVALKTVLPEMAAHPQLLGRFLTEMQITAQLEHPNVVPVYGLEVGADGTLGYAMKLVHGRDLSQLLTEARERLGRGEVLDGVYSLESRMEIFLKVCDALEFAHAKGIVHRDLKPANVMVGRHNEVYLMDWGIARPMGAGGQAVEAGIELNQADGEQTADLQRTRIGSAIGTPSYMSPEQAAGRNSELDGRSDQYAMGLILQECLTLREAVGGTTLQELLTKAKEAQRDPIVIGVRPGLVPRELEGIIRKATARRPEDRYASVQALAEDVRRYLRNDAVVALPDSALRKAARWVSKHRMASIVLMLSFALAGAGATIGTLIVGQRRVAAFHARELRVSELQTESAIQAQLVDRELTRYEAALSQFVGAAQLALEKQGAEGEAFFDEDFRKGAGPADLGASRRYGKDVSVLAHVFSLAPGGTREAASPVARSLGVLAPAFRELLIDTSGANSHKLSAAQERQLIADAGVPALRASLALKDGLTLTFPGVASPHKDDPRQQAWYKAADGQTGVHWSAPVTGDGGVLLPVSASVYANGQLRGVASLEVSLDRLLARGAAELDYVQTKLLVARDGKIMMEENGKAGRAPLAAAVLEAISKGRSGSLEYEEGGHKWIASYYPLATLDWYYVAIADVGQMLTSEQKVESSDPRKVMAGGAPRAPVSAAAPKPSAVAPPLASAAEEPDAGEPVDAGPPDAGVALPPPVRSALPKASQAAAPSAAPPAPTVAPSVSAIPKNPFDKWDAYQKKKEKQP